MENLNFFLSESWSTSAADQFFSMLAVNIANTTAVLYRSGGDMGMGAMLWNMLRFIGATVLVALLAWFVTKKLAGARRMGRKTGNLSVIESVNAGGNAVIQLVKAGDKYLVVGVTKERVTMLAEVDAEQITVEAPAVYNAANTPFGKILSRFMKPKEPPGDEDNDER